MQPPDNLQLASLTDTITINGRVFSSFFNAAQRTFTETSAAGRIRTVTLDAKGHVSTITVPQLAPVQVQYDTAGRVISLSQGTRATTFAYDNQNRLQSVTDPLRRTVTLHYDNADRVISQILPDQRVIGFGYDANGNLTAVTPPSRPLHAFTFTPIDLEASYTPPATTPGGATQYSYDKDRRLTLVTRPDGKTIQVSYDTAGRPSALTIARGNFAFAYSPTTGNLTSVTAPNGDPIAYTFDGFVLTKQTWSGTVSGSVLWVYDSDFALSDETVPCPTANTVTACQDVLFSYDSDKLLTGAGSETLTHDPQNGLLTATSIGALTDAWTYNGFGEPLTYAANVGTTPVLAEQYTRDDAGRIVTKTETINGMTTLWGYGYDTAGRLVSVTKDGASSAVYTYDDNGNRLTKTTPSGTENSSYDAQDAFKPTPGRATPTQQMGTCRQRPTRPARRPTRTTSSEI